MKKFRVHMSCTFVCPLLSDTSLLFVTRKMQTRNSSDIWLFILFYFLKNEYLHKSSNFSSTNLHSFHYLYKNGFILGYFKFQYIVDKSFVYGSSVKDHLLIGLRIGFLCAKTKSQ